MEFKRTANAGGLLRLDDAIILLDGVCQEVSPYLATPPAQRSSLMDERIGLFAFSHHHADHFDPAFDFPSHAPVIGTEEIAASLPDCCVKAHSVQIGSVTVTPVATRHMGKTTPAGHFSFVVEGSRCVWFMGDASPIELEKMKLFPKPDILIAPFPYASSLGAVRKVNDLGAEHLILVHLPLYQKDPDHLWDAVLQWGKQLHLPCSTPGIGDTIFL